MAFLTKILLILLRILLVLVFVYLLLIAPRIFKRPDWSNLLNQNLYAHRGLHKNRTEAPENSMLAFQRAVDAGYGIELDVQLTKDRIPVVFHDEDLLRMCGVEGKVRNYTFEELQNFPLVGGSRDTYGTYIPVSEFSYEENADWAVPSTQTIRKFADVLKTVDGRVPLIVEIKNYENINTVCSLTDELLKQYKGIYCVESFDPRAVRWFRKRHPQLVCGQLGANFWKSGHEKEGLPQKLDHWLLLNVLSRPDFIAYDHHSYANLSRRICTKVFGALPVAWTIKSQEELDFARKNFSIYIFEGFLPKL